MEPLKYSIPTDLHLIDCMLIKYATYHCKGNLTVLDDTPTTMYTINSLI